MEREGGRGGDVYVRSDGGAAAAGLARRTWSWSWTSSTRERFIASPRFILEMSQPPTTSSFGCTIGSILLNGTYTAAPAGSAPRRTVEACVSEPK